MEFQKDFADLCSLLNEKNVEFLIVGGYAVAFHGAPRFTGDLDILVRPDIEHVERALAAVGDFGIAAKDVTSEYALEAQKYYNSVAYRSRSTS